MLLFATMAIALAYDIVRHMKNPFVIFDIHPTFEIDMDDVIQRYKTLVRQYHPDVSISQDMSLQDINSAYLMLKSPIMRAKALLEIHHIIVDEEEILKNAEVLEEMFELKLTADPSKIQVKAQEAMEAFNQNFLQNNKEGMLKNYWRLRYLLKE